MGNARLGAFGVESSERGGPRRDGGLVGGRTVETGGWWTRRPPPQQPGRLAASARAADRGARPAGYNGSAQFSKLGVDHLPGKEHRGIVVPAFKR